MASALQLLDGITSARNDGYSDDEIYDHLAQKDSGFTSAKDDGYSFPEVYNHVLQKGQQEALGNQQQVFGAGTPLGGMLALQRGDLKTPDVVQPVSEQATQVARLPDLPSAAAPKKYTEPTPEELAQSAASMSEPLITLPKPSGPSVAAGVTRGVEGIAEGFTSPQNLALMASIEGMPLALRSIAGRAFLAYMAKQLPDQASEAYKVFQDPTKTKGDKAQAVTEFLGSAGLLGLGMKRPGEGGGPKELRSGGLTPEQADALTAKIQQHAQTSQVQTAAQLHSEVAPVLPRLPGDVQQKVQGIIDKQAQGQELSADERATMAQVRSYASKAAGDQTATEFTGPTEQQSTSTPAPSQPAAGEVAPSPQAEPTELEKIKQQMRQQTVAPVVEAASNAEQAGATKTAEAAKQIAQTIASKTSPPEEIAPEGKAAAEEPEAVEPSSAKSTSPIVGPALIQDGQIVAKGEVGKIHDDLVREGVANNRDLTDAQRGFHDAEGNPLSRTKAAQRALDTGVIDQATYDKVMAREGDGKGLHSEDLIEAARKTEPKVKKQAIDDFLATLGEDEEAPAGEKPLDTSVKLDEGGQMTPPKLTPRQIDLLLNKTVSRSGGTSLTDAEDAELGKLQEQHPGVSLEKEAIEQAKSHPSLHPVIQQILDSAQKSVEGLRNRISDVKMGGIKDGKEAVTFKLDGVPHEGVLKGRNRDLVLGTGEEADRAIANRVFLDGDAAPVESSGPTGKSTPKTKLEIYADSVKKSGKEVTIDVEDATPEMLRKIVSSAEAMGVSASTDGRFVLLRPKLEAEGVKGPTGEPPPTSESPISEAQKRVNDIRKDIENQTDATSKWKKQRAKDLKAAEAALAKEGAPEEGLNQETVDGYVESNYEQPLAETVKFLVENKVGDEQILKAIQKISPNFGAPELAKFKSKLGESVSEPPPAEKESWQKTREQVEEEGGSLAKHRQQVKQALADGKEVPLEVLESFKGNSWADKARESKYGQQISDNLLDRILKGLTDDGSNQYSDPLFIQSVGKPAIRAAVKLLQSSIEGGRLAKDALNDAINYLKEKIPNLNEQKAREFFDQFFEKSEVPPSEPVPEQPRVEVPNEPEQRVSPDEATTDTAGAPDNREASGRVVSDDGQKLTGEKDTTALKREVVDKQGAKEIPTETRLKDEQIVADAKARSDADPTLAKKLVSQIVDEGKTGITEQEAASLLVERRRLRNKRQEWEKLLGDPESGSTEKGQARTELKRIEDEQFRLDQAGRKAGREWSDVGRMYQREIAKDYSLEALEQKARAAKGGPLSEDEISKLKEKADKYEKEQARADALEEQASEGAAFEEMAKIYEQLVDDVSKENPSKTAPQTKTSAAKKAPLSQSIIDYAKSARESALQRIRARRAEGRLNALPVNELIDHAIVGASYIMEGVGKTAQWTKQMVDTFGPEVRPFLKEIRAASEEQVEKLKNEATKKKSKTVAQVKASLKADVTAGDGLNPKTLANLARAHIREGITGVDEVMKAVHQDVLEQFPDATEKDVRRALVKYGSEVAAPTRDAVEQQLAQLKSLVKVEEDIRNLEQNPSQPTWKSQRRQQHSDELRRLMKVRSELLKKANLPESETSLASRAKTRETALENRIKDIDHELQTGERPPEGTAVTRTSREEDLMMEKAAMEEKLKEIKAEARPVRSEADLTADKAQQAVDRAAAALDHQQRINSGEIQPEAKEKVQPLSDLEKELRDRTEELKKAKKVAEVPSVEEKAATAAQTGVDRAAAALDRWDQILKGEIVSEGKTPKEAMSDLQEELQSQVEAMKATHRELEKQNKPVKSTSDIREKMQLKSLEKAIAEYERRAKEVDLEPKGKREGPDSAQVAQAKQARDAAKKVVEEMRKARKTVKTPEEQYNERRGKQVEKMIAEAQRKLATKDYASKPKPAPLAQTAALAASEAKLRKMRQDIEQDMDRIAYEKKSGAAKAVASVAKLISGLKVVGHGTVGMITHAGAVWPRYDMQKIFWRNFGRQFGMWAKPEFHEQLIHQLTSDPEFEDWKNAGASIDPEKTYTDYGLYVNALKHLSEKGGKVGKGIANFLEGGQRGFDALKLARLEMNKAAWEKVPQEIKADPAQAAEMRRYIADMNNKATGSIPGKINPVGKDFEQGVYNIAKNPVVEVALFAPRLYASRWARIVIDPVKTSDTFRRMAMDKVTGQRTISPAQAEIAKIRLKNAAKFAAGYTAALAVNQAILSATGSDQKVNMTDPTKADWLKFKGFGKELVADGGLLDPVRLLGQVVIGDLIMDKKWRGEAGFKKAAVDLATYGRGKLSPSVGILADEATGRDFAGRPLPQGKTFFGLGTDIEDTIKKPKYGWGEWLSQQFTPIPVSGGVRVAYDEMRKEGMSHLDAVKMLKGAAMAALSFTGAHISEDHAQEMDQAEAKPGPKGTPRFSIRKRRAR